jgi:hypothetical protein
MGRRLIATVRRLLIGGSFHQTMDSVKEKKKKGGSQPILTAPHWS